MWRTLTEWHQAMWIIYRFFFSIKKIEVADVWKRFQEWNFQFWLVHKIFFLGGGFTVEGKLNSKEITWMSFQNSPPWRFWCLSGTGSNSPKDWLGQPVWYAGVDMALKLASYRSASCSHEARLGTTLCPWCQFFQVQALIFEIRYMFSVCRGELRRKKRKDTSWSSSFNSPLECLRYGFLV